MTSVDEKTEECEVETGEWPRFLEEFRRQHERNPATIEIRSATGRLIQAKTGRLLAIGMNDEQHPEHAYVELEEVLHGSAIHIIASPGRITVRQRDGCQELAITSVDGRKTVLLA
jgi:hypothetical protein